MLLNLIAHMYWMALLKLVEIHLKENERKLFHSVSHLTCLKATHLVSITRVTFSQVSFRLKEQLYKKNIKAHSVI